jgi:hypothetical protein
VALKIGDRSLPDLGEFGQMLAGPFEARPSGTASQRGYFDRRAAPARNLFRGGVRAAGSVWRFRVGLFD